MAEQSARGVDDDSCALAALPAVTIAARRAPELPALLLAACAGAVWATAAGPLPGTGLIARYPVAGSLLTAAAWLVLFVLLALCYRRVATPARLPSILRRLALVQIVVVAASVPAAFPKELLLFRAPYFKYLYLLAVGLGSLSMLLGPETRSLWRNATARRPGAAAAGAALTLASAAYAIGAMDLLLHVDGHWESKYQLRHAAFALNVGLLACIYAALFGLTARLGAALLLGTALCGALALANLGKMTYMHAAVHPLDLLYVSEFIPQLGSTFGVAGTAALIGGAVLLVAGFAACMRRRGPAPRWPYRAAALALALPPLLLPGLGQTYEPIRRSFAAAGIELKGWDSVLSVRQNGALLELLSYLPDIHVADPGEYSAQAVQAVVGRYDWGQPRPAVGANERRATLIIYMIESLMDPLALGRPLTADPIPNIRSLGAAHSSGYAVVPGRFGESASSEFELLTGMSMSFLPARSVAYKQYVKRGIPSLPCLLQSRGYRTVAVQADPIEFYNRREVYERLCFERTRWLHEDPAAPRAANGKAPADDAIVDAVIEEAGGAPHTFVFAFPSSTHHPYDSDVFAAADLDVLDRPRGSAGTELKYYVNALRAADAAVGRLVEHFAAVDREVVIAVLGDHLPPLTSAALASFYEGVGEDGLQRLLKERSVPLVVWSNFDHTRESLRISLNLLGPYLLEAAGVEPDGFLRFVDQLRGRFSLLSNHMVGAGGAFWTPETLPASHRTLIDDYRLLQHDVLFGRSYLASGLDAIRTAAAAGTD